MLEGGGQCTFRVWSPLKEKVSLVFNGRIHPMERRDDGYWEKTMVGVQSGDRYQFQLADGQPLPDIASRWQPDGVHGASAVAGNQFRWTDEDWAGLSTEELIIYELHTGTFTADGSFAGIIGQLDYLQELGITAIELMPVAAFPGNRNWGYDGVFPFAVHTAYGGIDGLKELVNAAHARGMAVILDVVYNHIGPEGNHFAEYGPYFTDKYKGVWGNVMNFDDEYCDGVRRYFWQNALQWLEEFHIDGLRLDAVHAIWDNGAHHFMDELRKQVAALSVETGRQYLLIAEVDLNQPRYIQPPEVGGYGLDAQWCDEFHHALHSLVTGEMKGYYEDFGTPAHLVRALRDGYVYTGQYSPHRKKKFGAYPQNTTCDQLVVFAQNHDQVGNRLKGERLSTQLSFEGLKLVAATVLLSPYVPLLFMGEEYGEKNPFQYFISHTDAELIEMVRKGRSEEFKHFFGNEEAPDPQGEDTFRQCMLSRTYTQDTQAAGLLSFYRYLINLRKQHPAMQGRQRHQLEILETGDEFVIGFRRFQGGDALYVFLNFHRVDARCTYVLPAGARRLLDSAGAEWLGPGMAAAGVGGGFTMRPESVLVFEISNEL